jgi:hypothetical protein
MRKLDTILIQLFLIFLFITSAVIDYTKTAEATEQLTVEGVWEVISVSLDSDKSYIGNRISIARQGARYQIQRLNSNDSWYCTGNDRRIAYTKMELLFSPTDELGGNRIPVSIAQKFAGQQVPMNTYYTLSADGNYLTIESETKLYYWDTNTATGEISNFRYEIKLANNNKVLKRISGTSKEEVPSQHAYKADCGMVDPNKPTSLPPDHEYCSGNLTAMTYFCGGDMGCPYVCCPKGLPYLNHCDCKCYAASDFDCHSYSYCREKLLK